MDLFSALSITTGNYFTKVSLFQNKTTRSHFKVLILTLLERTLASLTDIPTISIPEHNSSLISTQCLVGTDCNLASDFHSEVGASFDGECLLSTKTRKFSALCQQMGKAGEGSLWSFLWTEAKCSSNHVQTNRFAKNLVLTAKPTRKCRKRTSADSQ